MSGLFAPLIGCKPSSGVAPSKTDPPRNDASEKSASHREPGPQAAAASRSPDPVTRDKDERVSPFPDSLPTAVLAGTDLFDIHDDFEHLDGPPKAGTYVAETGGSVITIRLKETTEGMRVTRTFSEPGQPAQKATYEVPKATGPRFGGLGANRSCIRSW